MSRDGILSNVATQDNVNVQIRTGWLYEVASHAEQAIEDLFALLASLDNPAYFTRDVVTYNASDVKNYIWKFKTDDLEYVVKQFRLPHFDITDDSKWTHKEVFDQYNCLAV